MSSSLPHPVHGPASRQPRAAATREALLHAGGHQFAAVGYHRASLRVIAERAGVTKGALYFHFTGKQSLAEAVIVEMISVWKRVVAEVETQGLDPLSSLIISTGHAAERMLSDPIVRGGTRLLNDPAVATAWAGAHYRHTRDMVRAQLTAAAAAGLLRPHVDLVVLARSVVTLLAGHNLVCERTDTLGELTGHIGDMWRALLPLIATDPWLQRWDQADRRGA